MNDDFSFEKEWDDQKDPITNKERFNNVLAYIPFLNLYLLFTQNEATREVGKKYVRQWMALFLVYIALFIIVTIISWKLGFLLTAVYLIGLMFFATQAYNDMYTEIDALEQLISWFDKKKQTEKNGEEPSKTEDVFK